MAMLTLASFISSVGAALPRGGRIKTVHAVVVVALGVALPAVSPTPVAAQDGSGRTSIGALPAVGYDADEGWEYGILAEIYHYPATAPDRYDWTFQFLAEATTQGRREFLVFYDAPGFLGSKWRVSANALSIKQIALPFYGIGNASVFDETLETTVDEDFYRYTRQRDGGSVTLQRDLGELPLRLLIGGGVNRTTLRARPDGADVTLLDGLFQGGDLLPAEGWYNHLRAGLVWDSRDQETGPNRGAWREVLVQHHPTWLGSETSFTRWTLTERHYLPVAPRLVLANRILLQGIVGDAPFHEITRVQSSFKEQGGLGGSKTLRGVLWNRYQGEGLFLWNAEARWDALGFGVFGRDFRVVLSGFVDSGRVWESQVRLGEVLSDLHTGWGGGLRVVMGQDFVVGIDLGTSRETGAQLYTGLGYLF